MTLKPTTVKEFNKLSKMLLQFLQVSPNADRYLDEAIKIQNRSVEEELYPNNK